MARMTLRLPDDLKREMDQQEEINWSAFVRNQIKREVDHPNPPRKVKQFIHDEILDDGDRVELAWALHLLITKSNERRREDTASLLFQGSKVDYPLAEVESRLSEIGLEELDKDVGRNLTVKQALGEELADSGLLEEIKDACCQRIQDAPREDRALVWLLAQHVSHDLDREDTSVKPHGIGKAHALFTKQDYDKDRVSETLTELGLVYHGYYSSNQYGYDNHTVPNYALALLEDFVDGDTPLQTGLSTPDKRTIRKQLGTDEFTQFLEWLDGSHQYVNKYQEEDELDGSYPDGAAAFREYASRLIREGILTVSYRPHRSSKGGNSGARPARWKYEITRDAFDSLGEVLLEEGFISMDA